MHPRTIALRQVPTLVFGPGALALCRDHLLTTGAKRILAITSPSNRRYAEQLLNTFPKATIDDTIRAEPTVAMFQHTLAQARTFAPDLIVGLGGGSPLDVSKLIAALTNSTQTHHRSLRHRQPHLPHPAAHLRPHHRRHRQRSLPQRHPPRRVRADEERGHQPSPRPRRHLHRPRANVHRPRTRHRRHRPRRPHPLHRSLREQLRAPHDRHLGPRRNQKNRRLSRHRRT